MMKGRADLSAATAPAFDAAAKADAAVKRPKRQRGWLTQIPPIRLLPTKRPN